MIWFPLPLPVFPTTSSPLLTYPYPPCSPSFSLSPPPSSFSLSPSPLPLPSSLPLPSPSPSFPWTQATKYKGATSCVSLSWTKERHVESCEWDMKLEIVPLWSASKELSNDVLYVIFDVGHIFAKNHTQPEAIIHGFSWFGSKFNVWQNGHHLKALFMLITMVQISASYLIPNLRYIYHISYPMYSSTWMDIGIVNPSIYKWNIRIGILPVKRFSYWTVQHNPPHYTSHFNV